jgi:adenylosuccinate lyase
MDVWQTGKNFRDVLLADDEVTRVLASCDLDEMFDLKKSIRNVDYIFGRVGLA